MCENNNLEFLTFGEGKELYRKMRNLIARNKYQEKNLPKEIKPENVCECGGHYKSKLNRHLETKKHKLFLCGK